MNIQLTSVPALGPFALRAILPDSVSHRLHFPGSIANWCQVGSAKGKPSLVELRGREEG